MSIWEALLLGIVQGLTEFLPISSSGHLVVVPFITGISRPTLAFTVATHIGTLVAVTWALWDRVRPLLDTLRNWKSAAEGDRNLVRLIAIGTVPAAIAGLTLESFFERAFERPVMSSLELGITAWFLFYVESKREQRRASEDAPEEIDESEMTAKDALIVGGAQAVSILPGISRSGATIGVAMLRGISRQAAARYSFLLSIPALAGAAVIEAPDMVREAAAGAGGEILAGMIAAGISGFIAVRWFLSLVRTKDLRPFGVYLTFLMVAGLLAALARG